MVGDRRQKKIQDVVSQRMVSVVPVLEKFYDWGNVSAVLRTAEALGFQQVHLIRNEAKGKRSRRTTQGADKWLDIAYWHDTTQCLVKLKEQGYRIVVTDLDESSVPIQELPLDKPLALVFGSELAGVSSEARGLADIKCHIPMRGFTQSFNVSVAAGIMLYELRRRKDELPSGEGDLPEAEQELLNRYYWFLSTRLRQMLPG